MSLDLALKWAAAGWPVFPFGNRGRGFHEWQRKATTHRPTLEGWDWSDASVGVVPGLAGCFALDVDIKKGKDGEGELARLLQETDVEGWEIPQQSTPSGGRHLFWRGHVPTTVEGVAPGLDTRGGDAAGSVGKLGFVFAYGPPPCAAADAPEPPPSVYDRLRAGRVRTPQPVDPGEGRVVAADTAANLARARDYLARLPAVVEGSRNLTLFKTAAVLRDLGIAEATGFGLLAEFPAVFGNPPLEVDEAHATVLSAFRNGQLPVGTDAVDPGTIAALAAEEAARNPSSPGERQRAPRRRLSFWSDRRDRPPLPWLVRRVLPQRALVGLYGPGGSYKSFLALDLSLRIARGDPSWAGEDILGAGPVVYASGEGALEPRVRAWEAAHGPVDDRFAMLEGLSLADVDGIVAACEEIEAAVNQWTTTPALVVIDTLHAASGGLDENSARDMGQVLQAANGIKERLGATVLLVHHTPKGTDTWRGSGAVYFGLDTAIKVKAKSPMSAELFLERQKDGVTGAKFTAALERRETGRHRDGEAEASLVVSGLTRKGGAGENITPGQQPEAQKERLQRVQAVLLIEQRVEVARKVFSAMKQGATIGPGGLARTMSASLGGAEVEALRRWLYRAAKDEEHPLAGFVALKDPLTFIAPVVAQQGRDE